MMNKKILIALSVSGLMLGAMAFAAGPSGYNNNSVGMESYDRWDVQQSTNIQPTMNILPSINVQASMNAASKVPTRNMRPTTNMSRI